jgi:hypothetical protein
MMSNSCVRVREKGKGEPSPLPEVSPREIFLSLTIFEKPKNSSFSIGEGRGVELKQKPHILHSPTPVVVRE